MKKNEMFRELLQVGNLVKEFDIKYLVDELVSKDLSKYEDIELKMLDIVLSYTLINIDKEEVDTDKVVAMINVALSYISTDMIFKCKNIKFNNCLYHLVISSSEPYDDNSYLVEIDIRNGRKLLKIVDKNDNYLIEFNLWKDIEYYRKNYKLTEEQLYEISMGIFYGVNVDEYANNKLTAEHMRVYRRMLMDGLKLDVDFTVSIGKVYEQFEEHGIAYRDVSKNN